MKIAVYGNLIHDTIVGINSPLVIGESNNAAITYALGGIANFCRAGHTLFDLSIVTALGNDKEGDIARLKLAKYGDLIVHESALSTSQAIVIADTANNIRTGLVQWGACRHFSSWQPVKADWHHIMYLDRLNIDDLTPFVGQGIVSADFCDSAEIESYRHLMHQIDYLIVADLDHQSLLKLDLPVRRCIIAHNPKGSYCAVGSLIVMTADVETVNNLNVVGAGDYFAAYCIANLMVDHDIDLNNVHARTLDQLRAQS